VTLGRRGREPAGRGPVPDERWGVVEVEELPTQRVALRKPDRPRLGVLIATSVGIALLAAGLGALGGRPAPRGAADVAVGPPSAAPLAAYTGEPLERPTVPCRQSEDAPPGIDLNLGGRAVHSYFLVDLRNPPQPASPGTMQSLPPALDVRSDLPAEVRVVGDVCAVAWQIQLRDDNSGTIELETMGNPSGNPLVAAQNRFRVALGQHRGSTGWLQASLSFPSATLQAWWLIRILPFQAPSARLTLADLAIDLAQGCDVNLTLGSGWNERLNPCFDDVDRAQEAASIASAAVPLLFRFRDGWRVDGPAVGCGQLSERRFLVDGDCRIDARVDGDALVIEPPTPPGTWTLSIGACGIQELADATNTICGTWYATVDVRA
jgi:hypothetical protein